ncbi:MAG: sensor histidine kinase [Chloroflexi bacterium]|nr:MAG: sensor histidine kinase [Chloroflexota bacterium]
MDAQPIVPKLDASSGLPEKRGGILAGRWHPLIQGMWVTVMVMMLVILVASIPGYLANLDRAAQVNPPAQMPAPLRVVLELIIGFSSLSAVLVCWVLAGLLFWRKPGDRIALFVSFYLLVYAIGIAGPLENLERLIFGAAFHISSRFHHLFFTIPTVWLLVLFPNGRFVPAWTRWLAGGALAWIPFIVFFLPANWWMDFDGVWLYLGGFLWLLTMGLAIYAQIYRYRRMSTPTERQQTKWVVSGFTFWMAGVVLLSIPHTLSFNLPPGQPTPWWMPVSSALWGLSLVILPVSLTIAVWRYRLWDIDVIINRTLVYGSLTAIVVGIYMLVVGSLGMLLHVRGSLFISLLGTGLVALLLQPLRERLQRAVNRLMYGERDDPYAVLSRLAQRLEATLATDNLLDIIAETVAQALRLPYVAIALNEGGHFKPIAEHCTGQGAERRSIVDEAGALTLPLVHQAEIIGQLIVAPRTPGEGFSPADQRLLADIAHQAGVAAQAARLAADLQRSRERLVTSREEERRRLRRDLHDGLGPTLASHSFQLEEALELLAGDPASGAAPDPVAATALLRDLKTQTQAMVADIRRLIYQLRPPALDELGLLGALQIQAAKLAGANQTLRIAVAATPAVLPPLPAAVEVAAYRIVLEALTNVTRHAQARTCHVYLAVSVDQPKTLEVTIIDDGLGLPFQLQAGVGLISMRERAEELGGACLVEAGATGGTHVRARLPLSSPEAS